MLHSKGPAARLNRGKSPVSAEDAEAAAFAKAVRANKNKFTNTPNEPLIPDWAKTGGMILAALMTVNVAMRMVPGLGGSFAFRGGTERADQRTVTADCLVVTAKAGPEDDSPWGRHDSIMIKLASARDALAELSDQCSEGVSRKCRSSDRLQHREALIKYLDLRHDAFELAYRKAGKGGVAFLNKHFSSKTDAGILADTRSLLDSGIEIKAFLQPAHKRHLELLLKHGDGSSPICFRPTKT